MDNFFMRRFLQSEATPPPQQSYIEAVKESDRIQVAEILALDGCPAEELQERFIAIQKRARQRLRDLYQEYKDKL